MAVENRDAHVGGDAFVSRIGSAGVDKGEESGYRIDGDGGAREILFSGEEFVGGIAGVFEAGQFGAIGDGLSYQVGRGSRRAGGKLLFDQLISGGLIGA